MNFRKSISLLILILVSASCAQEVNTPGPQWTQEDRNVLIEGLTKSLDSLKMVVEGINPEYLFMKPDSNSWSVAEVTEHLVLQDQAYFRELTAVSSRPEETEFAEDLRPNDQKFLEYATDPNPGQADWFAVPTGNYRDFAVVLGQFIKVREETLSFIRGTDSDLRRHYTFRNIPDGLLEQEFYRVRKVRDLHQLMLNEIAHTYRHIGQINRIKSGLGLE